ncbi:conserved Plasmodium protein, unknown function [Plasmodium gallinaceum]|uniref:C6H2-type domain-containing protein n=1 Tax=Plasmodium gallinaceum TaxID=5849 RepID=A0A1J1GXU9_PLAGA|nr:conserved Plasmodium protein, unknown function [Plasmodium gallinaceum]CRG95832.1 conserved Plasmodium protein, unknown function [Plasmodium gallinaceum]
MTICSGCGIVTDVTICCPICLKHNKKIFYCSQECYEKNYKDHKKIHYFIKIINSEEMYKMNEQSTTNVNDNLPVVILSNENESENENIKIFQNDKNSHKRNSVVNGYNSIPIKNCEETNMYNNLKYKNVKNSTFEKKDRKKNYNKYKNITNDYLLNEMEENNSKNYLKKGSFKNKLSYITNIISYLFSNKYNLILPCYDDVDSKCDKGDFKNLKIKNKLSDKQMNELKRQLRIKKVLQLIVLLMLISIILILSTYMFSIILESSNKNIENVPQNLKNKGDINRNSDILELKQYIKVIEDLRKEINEIKEVLYMHNIYINKNFSLNNSYNIFNNFNKTKPNTSHHNKKLIDKTSSLTSHNYYSNSYSDENYNKTILEEDNSPLKQYHYDVNDINELNSTNNKDINKDSYNESNNINVEKNISPDNTLHTYNDDIENFYNRNEKKNSDMNKSESENNSNEEADMQNNQNFFTQNQPYNEDNSNFIKNHEQNEYEEATISNRIVNEEKIISSNSIGDNNRTKNEVLENGKSQDSSLIFKHEMKEKPNEYSSKIEENEREKNNRKNIDTEENSERKSMSSKLNKKKQKMI